MVILKVLTLESLLGQVSVFYFFLFVFLFWAVLEIKHRDLYMLGKGYVTEL